MFTWFWYCIEVRSATFQSRKFYQLQGVTKRMDGPVLKSRDYNFTLSASILQNEFFIMNLSLKGGTVCFCGSIEIEDTHKNVFPVRSQLFLSLKQKF